TILAGRSPGSAAFGRRSGPRPARCSGPAIAFPARDSASLVQWLRISGLAADSCGGSHVWKAFPGKQLSASWVFRGVPSSAPSDSPYKGLSGRAPTSSSVLHERLRGRKVFLRHEVRQKRRRAGNRSCPLVPAEILPYQGAAYLTCQMAVSG